MNQQNKLQPTPWSDKLKQLSREQHLRHLRMARDVFEKLFIAKEEFEKRLFQLRKDDEPKEK